LLFINLVDINNINKWLAWVVMTILLSYPNGMLVPLPPPNSLEKNVS
jgi:hypothetical protein